MIIWRKILILYGGKKTFHGFNLKLNYIMIRKTKKTRKYHAPSVKVTFMALESNFCQTLRVNAHVDELRNMNAVTSGDDVEQLYFEF